ncbi:MAG: peptidylprolyl isomerase, partial [Candidatus Cloacimonadales bacterium]
MKTKIIILLSILLSFACLQALVVATVEDREITESMLQSKIAEFDDEYSTYGELKKAALNELINEALLLNYAEQNEINVDQYEVDAYFYSQLGNHPNFMDEGKFSQAKYENFKFTNRGKRILAEMQRELLLAKVQELIIKDYNLTDHYLYQKFLIENRQIEINYAIIDIDKVNIPLHYSVEGARRYYENNQENILTDAKIKLDFYYFSKADYLNIAQQYILADSVNADSLSVIELEKEAARLAREEAEKLLLRLRQNQLADRPLFSSGYLQRDEAAGIISPQIIQQAFADEPKDFAQITAIPQGFLIYRVAEIIPPQPASLDQLKDKVWAAYIKDERIKNQQQYEDIFIANIDKFITAATIVKKIYLDKPSFFSGKSLEEYQQDLSAEIRKNLHDDSALEKIIKSNKLQTENVAIYQRATQNSQAEDRLISARLAEGEENGVLRHDERVIIFKSTLYFPEYIPQMSDVLPELQELISDITFEEADLLKFYEENKQAFVTSDSLQLGICYFPKLLDNFELS